jgi:hypothetical protein
MKDKFLWNPYADQPHNIVPKKERFLMHFHHLRSYLTQVKFGIWDIIPVLRKYHQLKKEMYNNSVKMNNSQLAVSISPIENRNEEVVEKLLLLGVKNTLIRVPSWEIDKLNKYLSLIEILNKEKISFVIAILQNREDILNPQKWKESLREIFSAFYSNASYFEIGHAWNRTKWGVWDFKEYLKLLDLANEIKKDFSKIKFIGPAVIDFEFHLIHIILKYFDFDIVSSLLYVDRHGAPENTQFGWDTSKKVCLLKAIIEYSKNKSKDCWITEVNWPLKGTGKYSPAAGRPNVSEEEYANFLIRYHLLCLCTGFIGRIFWWQLIAPGYGLIDNRSKKWRLRPGYWAYKNMVKILNHSIFIKKIEHPLAQIFLFKNKENNHFVIAWSPKKSITLSFLPKIERILERDGKEISPSQKIVINSSPKYIYLKSKEIPEKIILNE